MIIKRSERHGEGSLSVGDFSMLLKAGQAVDSSARLDDALKTVLSSAKAFIGAHEGSLMLLDPDGDLRLVASEGIPADIVPSVRVKPGEGVAGRVLQTGRPLLLTVPPSERDFDSFVDKKRPLRAAVSVPLRAGEKVIGVLNLNLVSGRRTFNEEDLRRAEIFARQAAMAVQKTQWLEQAQHRAGELGLLVDAAKALAGDVAMEPVLHRALDGAVKLIGGPAGLICVFDPGSKRVSMCVYRGLMPASVQQATGRAEVLALADAAMPLSVPVAGNPALAALGSADQHVTVLPVEAGENVRAGIFLVGARPSDSRLALARAFAVQAGIAITNARYYEELKEKDSETSAILAMVPGPVILTDPEGRIMMANPAAESLFSFSTEFTRGQPAGEFLHEPELTALMESEEAGEVEVVMGAVPKKWRARASAISPMGGTARGRVLVLEDVSSGREAQQSRKDLVAVLGHELRTPLTLIKAYLDTLILRGFRLTPEQIGEALNTAASETRRLERLIENLIFVNSPDQDPVLNVQEVDVAALARDLAAEFRQRSEEREVAVEGAEAAAVKGDPARIEQSLYQLIDNAVKFSPAGTPIRIVVEEKEAAAHIAVVDRGQGILSGDIPTLFESFSQVDSSATREHGGTGTGLHIARRLAEAHGGTIKVESIWGKGSTFRLVLPKEGPPESAAEDKELLPAPGAFPPRRDPVHDEERHAQETLGLQPSLLPDEPAPLEKGPPIELPEPSEDEAEGVSAEPPQSALDPVPVIAPDAEPQEAPAGRTEGGEDALPVIAPDPEELAVAPPEEGSSEQT